MHPNPAFRKTPDAENLKFLRDMGFGTLAVNGEAGPLLSHVPYLVAEDGGSIDLHLVRSNPIVRAAKDPIACVLSVTGPHSYVSPDWYGIDDQVPTWNYVAVHARGQLTKLPDGDLYGVLERLSARFEAELPKPLWTMGKMDDEALARMMRMIVPFRLDIEDLQGTWKLNQNKPDDVRLAAADGVEKDGIGDGLAQLAHWMRNVADG